MLKTLLESYIFYKEAVLDLYKKIISRICAASEIIAVCCLAAMFIMMVFQIIARYFFNNIPPGWLEELASQFMIIFIIIGMAVGVRDKIHITLSIIVDSMTKKIKLPVEIIGKILTLTLGLMISFNMYLLFSILRYNRLPGTRIPVIWIYAFPAAVGLLIALIAVYQIYDHFKSGTDEEQTRPEDFIN